MPKTNTQVHREMLMRNNAGSTTQSPLGQLESNYYTAQSGITGNSLRNKEIETYRKKIGAAGGVPSGNFKSDLIKQLLAALGLPVSNSYRQNRRTLELSL